jgi:Transglycosylase SLT domain/D-alanyl-D-alanine carboxypeptidase
MATTQTTTARLQAMARRVAREQGIPESLFLALIQQESGWNPGAGSSAGAQGLTQLMPGTARGLGVQNITDPLQNLTGGAKYLKAQLNRFGSPALALSAYNSGPGGAEAQGRVEAFPETQAYVKNVMALEAQYGGGGGGGGGGAAGVTTAPPSPMGEPTVESDVGAPETSGLVNSLTRSSGAPLPTLGDLISRVSPSAQSTLLGIARKQQGDQATVQQDQALVESPTPHDDSAPPVSGGLNAEFSRRLHQLMKAVEQHGGTLTISSGSRGVPEQTQLWNAAVKKYGSEAAARKWVAPPGKSNHDPQSGRNHGMGDGALAVDLSGDLDMAHELATRFGLTFPLSNEAWHIEPAGIRGK